MVLQQDILDCHALPAVAGVIYPTFKKESVELCSVLLHKWSVRRYFAVSADQMKTADDVGKAVKP